MMQMFRTVAGISRAEKAVMSKLVDAHEQLERTDGHIDMNSPSGKAKVEVFLKAIGAASDTLNIACASRAHRASFTSNYKYLFPAASKNFHIDLLKASIDNTPFLYVNGDKFEVSALVISSAMLLQNSWNRFCDAVKRHGGPGNISGHAALDEVRSALTHMDSVWATFEQNYITALIEIEAKARSYIVKAVEFEAVLTIAEHNKADVLQKRRDLVGSIAQLNSVANRTRKGRDDLDASIIEEAMATVATGSDRIKNGQEALMLAKDVIDSFEAMRAYLRQAGRVLERVDPHLCKNAGLVQRLVFWEETWEVGRKYVCCPPMLYAIGDLISEFRRVQRAAPALEQMCENCDVELFLCLPRIIWLRFLNEPEDCVEVVKDILPHRFPAKSSPFDLVSVDQQLRSFQDHYERVCEHLLRTHPVWHQSDVWQLLARRIVVGTDGADAFFRSFCGSPGALEEMKAVVESLMNDLEGWSLELQRHCPQEWNNCSSLLVQCILGGRDEAELSTPVKDSEFRV